ncbi:MAG: hypothetical protein A2Y62_06085 [Candidatus Fischerbacteria bacterium RBG_13_37_8]|uniref:Single-stranded DNA-binding protein n=1 Tax=Candidatus Fischerbacteria bacterium RBG_13_37_8 TaxID=1817863 RepID=A0A1F5VRC3_9BACT|nr:MAG: hypothetical protein A2Y62_06085 [Candidatus Fischerbacteria bacterium RBG_13_37_8]
MRYVNKVILVGRAGKDPEVRYTPSGTPVANFSLATTDFWNDASGKRQEKTEWHRIVAWTKLAEFCNQYVTKGMLLWVEGSIQSRTWQDRDGQQRTTYEIRAREIIILEPKQAREQEELPAGTMNDTDTASEEAPIMEDDIPF